MAYRLQITDKTTGVNANVRYENLARAEKPPVVAKTPNGNVVKERSIFNGQVLAPGSTQRQWVDDDGNIYSKQELAFWYEGEQVEEVSQTKVLEIREFAPLANYTDAFVMDKFYEVFPDDNGMKKDIDRDIARRANLYQMRKLWEHLKKNEVVGRGEFNTSSRGFVAGDGYIRAVEFGNKWGLEIGMFREEKVFQHLNEAVPQEVAMPQKATRKLKRV